MSGQVIAVHPVLGREIKALPAEFQPSGLLLVPVLRTAPAAALRLALGLTLAASVRVDEHAEIGGAHFGGLDLEPINDRIGAHSVPGIDLVAIIERHLSRCRLPRPFYNGAQSGFRFRFRPSSRLHREDADFPLHVVHRVDPGKGVGRNEQPDIPLSGRERACDRIAVSA
ncbi:hypothetical protein V3589_13215 [Sinorhizobium fredii]